MVDYRLISFNNVDSGFDYRHLVTALFIITVESIAQHG
jgi:hypothetical protein